VWILGLICEDLQWETTEIWWKPQKSSADHPSQATAQILIWTKLKNLGASLGSHHHHQMVLENYNQIGFG